MHARIGTFTAPAERLHQVVTLFRDRVVPKFAEHPGFLGYQGYVDEAHGRFVGISLWATRAALEASGETARGALAEAARLGAATLGEPQILELAFDSNASRPSAK